MSSTNIRIGTRKSDLAMVQTTTVASLLPSPSTIVKISTTGDKILDTPLALIPGKSLFTKELENALLNKDVDVVVHSLKDVGGVMPDGLVLGCILKREDPSDVLVLPDGGGGKTAGTLKDLPDGSVVGTGSVRRIGQIKSMYPNLVFKDVVCCLYIYIFILFLCARVERKSQHEAGKVRCR
jgi:hydroxymethylbilane synthase